MWHYEHRNFLDISIRMSIHEHYDTVDTYKDYKIIDREINDILNEHLKHTQWKKWANEIKRMNIRANSKGLTMEGYTCKLLYKW